eukprot:TRINITY_DN11940_c0_g1_i2.p1 TRINITY_DN11940_c0_g1~~TRINITY_DN11940_c0_g1_i2.p1  ORF type:complete len:110 (+),score=22.57 TRINITY_DN11940_c0_g1_i2:199-528(+)
MAIGILMDPNELQTSQVVSEALLREGSQRRRGLVRVDYRMEERINIFLDKIGVAPFQENVFEFSGEPQRMELAKPSSDEFSLPPPKLEKSTSAEEPVPQTMAELSNAWE